MAVKGHKNKRGARGSTESTDLDQTNAKRFQEESNVVATADSEEVEEEIGDNEEPSLNEIRGILVEIQITVSDIQRKQNHLAEELVTLRKDFNLQKMERASAKSDLEKVKKENKRLQRELEDVRKKAARWEEEIEELYVLQDELEQYTRKNSLEIHGIPESAYDSTEDVLMEVSEALDVEIKPEDIDISHKLFSADVREDILNSVHEAIDFKFNEWAERMDNNEANYDDTPFDSGLDVNSLMQNVITPNSTLYKEQSDLQATPEETASKSGQSTEKSCLEDLVAEFNPEKATGPPISEKLAELTNVLGLSANRQVNLARRDLLRSHLNKPYQSLCNPSTPITSYLFGDDLNKQVDDLSKANKIGHKVQGPSTKPRYHPKSSSGARGRGYRQNYLGRGRGSSYTPGARKGTFLGSGRGGPPQRRTR
ncbi:intraflagellar transport protein 74 homolog [Acropora muricata]|uniref:intraflagellar transport protein 74 homolog n=1 Tax=Acropora muricata TaxID=159855 RepID=UPI0034E52B07